MGVREALQSKPWIGWAVAAVALLLAALVWYRAGRGSLNEYTFDRLTEDVTIRDRETGEEWVMKRGRVEQILWDRAGALDPNEGIPNPTTGKPTGFPKSDWESTVERINRDRIEAARLYGRTGTPAPGKKGTGK
jgi:hypothetical protein